MYVDDADCGMFLADVVMIETRQILDYEATLAS